MSYSEQHRHHICPCGNIRDVLQNNTRVYKLSVYSSLSPCRNILLMTKYNTVTVNWDMSTSRNVTACLFTSWPTCSLSLQGQRGRLSSPAGSGRGVRRRRRRRRWRWRRGTQRGMGPWRSERGPAVTAFSRTSAAAAPPPPRTSWHLSKSR